MIGTSFSSLICRLTSPRPLQIYTERLLHCYVFRPTSLSYITCSFTYYWVEVLLHIYVYTIDWRRLHIGWLLQLLLIHKHYRRMNPATGMSVYLTYLYRQKPTTVPYICRLNPTIQLLHKYTGWTQEAKYVERWPSTTSAWSGWSRFDIPVDWYGGVHSLLRWPSRTLGSPACH